jgi:hypothetical protein
MYFTPLKIPPAVGNPRPRKFPSVRCPHVGCSAQFGHRAVSWFSEDSGAPSGRSRKSVPRQEKEGITHRKEAVVLQWPADG